MAVPKRKTSKSKSKMRDSSKYLVAQNISYDKEGNPHLQHHATYIESEGAYYYKGRKVLQLKNKNKKTAEV